MAAVLSLDDLSVPAPPPGPADWNDDGVVILRGAIGDDDIDRYKAAWRAAHGYMHVAFDPGAYGVGGSRLGRLEAARPHGWDYATPYMDCPELLDLCSHPAIHTALADLIGEPAGLHLNLTGWVSTERNWHQDGYLNPEGVGDAYAAVWIALGNIVEGSGPFQYIPGSHRWHRLTRALIARHVDLSDPQWPKHTEDFLTPLVEDVVRNAGPLWAPPGGRLPPIPEVVNYFPRRGDVLIWHPRLYHRGSAPAFPGAYRPTVIAHYSGIRHRPDMPTPEWHRAGYYFPIRSRQPTR